MPGMTVKWNGRADGPYVHIDGVLAYLADTRAFLMKDLVTEEARVAMGPLVKLVDALSMNYRQLKADATRARLDTLSTRVDLSALTDDLLALRDELEQGPT